MTPDATPQAIAFLIVLGMIVAIAMIVAFWQTWNYDWSEPPQRPEEPWERNSSALYDAIHHTTVELVEADDELNERSA